MQKRLLTLLLCWFHCVSTADADDAATLDLQCYVSANHYALFDSLFEVKAVNLKGLKHQPGGAVKVFTQKPYEFWVMIHKQQTIENVSTAENFQVALRNMNTGEFIHALSNSRNPAFSGQLSARISLVEYSPHSMIETGELLFECKTLL